MISDETQLEIRKFLKRLGIQSQIDLISFLKKNDSIDHLDIKVDFAINNKQSFTVNDKIKVIK